MINSHNSQSNKHGSIHKTSVVIRGIGVTNEVSYADSHEGILPYKKSTFDYLAHDPIHGHIILDWVNPDSRIGGFNLPGHGDPYGDCGLFFKKGCPDVNSHVQGRLDGVKVEGKIFVKVRKKSCGRAECPVCYEKWASKEARKIEYRLKQWKTGGRVIHLVLSVPKSLWYLDYKKLRPKSYLIAKKVKFLGGSCIFHPFRRLENTKQWYFSPHFHMIGYGWIKNVAENYEESGWVVVNLRERKSVFATAMYQLSHAGVHKKFHTVTWFGHLAYNRLKVVPEVEERDKCPLCGKKLVRLVWVGEDECPIPDVEGQYFLDPEGWVENYGLWSV